MRVNQGDVVLLPYPFSNLESTKVRPALVISNNNFNRRSQDCIMIPLTTVSKDVDYSIQITQEDFYSGKLLKTSRVRMDKVFSLEKDLIKMKIGTIKKDTFSRIKKEVFGLF